MYKQKIIYNPITFKELEFIEYDADDNIIVHYKWNLNGDLLYKFYSSCPYDDDVNDYWAKYHYNTNNNITLVEYSTGESAIYNYNKLGYSKLENYKDGSWVKRTYIWNKLTKQKQRIYWENNNGWFDKKQYDDNGNIIYHEWNKHTSGWTKIQYNSFNQKIFKQHYNSKWAKYENNSLIEKGRVNPKYNKNNP